MTIVILADTDGEFPVTLRGWWEDRAAEVEAKRVARTLFGKKGALRLVSIEPPPVEHTELAENYYEMP